MKFKLDDLDRSILRLLQVNAELSNKEIGTKLNNRSISTIYGRIERLKKQKIILTKICNLDRQQLGLALKGFITVKLNNPTAINIAAFKKDLLKIKGIYECLVIVGHYNFMLQIITKDTSSFGEIRKKVAMLDNIVDMLDWIVTEDVITNKGLDF